MTGRARGERRAVVLVPGFFDRARKMAPMARFLSRRGFEAHAVAPQPSSGRIGLEAQARQLAAFADGPLAGRPFDLVGFSMGGLVARVYVQRLGGAARVGRLVTLSSPHRGTVTARAWPGPAACEMEPGSALLRELNADAQMLERHGFTSLWTPFDLMIVPAPSSRLGVGREVRLPVLAHPLMVTDRRALAAVAEALEGPE